ncbi:MAG: alpha/beta hydrolase [Muribaculaceae bacterium]|nr:alpha/beta hydrolase [Muribaculaceae bacterium]
MDTTPQNIWQPDHLGSGYEMTHITQPDDYSGHVRCTVIRRLSSAESRNAILYVHGFSDYFLQKEMADEFVSHGYNFYAVDLRKYGRSLMPGQKMFQVRNLQEYFADIDAAIKIIHSDNNTRIILMGHSTGGLTTSLYMSRKPAPQIKALILNSPFLDWNLPSPLRKIGIPLISTLGRITPSIRVRQKPDNRYARTLSSEHGGEWTYRKEWKPDILPDPDMGWIRAIQSAQQHLRHNTCQIKVPILLMRSAESVKKSDNPEKYYRADAILDTDSIAKYGRKLSDDVTEAIFTGGLHDLALSPYPIRTELYHTIFTWLASHGL